MDTKATKNTYYFLQDGGEAGALLRSINWLATVLGGPDGWPAALRHAVRFMLDSPIPMYVAWGNEFVMLYNDGYIPTLGKKRHPLVMGLPLSQSSPQVFENVEQMFAQVMRGEKVGRKDFKITLDKNGFPEECYFDLSYIPIHLDDGSVGGLQAVFIETTEKVKAIQKLKESNDQLQFAIEATELATWDFNPEANTFTANQRYTDWFGIPATQETSNELALRVIAEEDRERVITAYQNALLYSSGGVYDVEYTIRPPGLPERILRAKGMAWFNEEKIAYRFNGTLQDVTAQARDRRLLEQSEQRFRKLLLQSPFAVAIFKGHNMVITLANDAIKELWGKGADVEGRSLFEVLPELNNQAYPKLLGDVFATGEAFIGDETLFKVERNGVLQDTYLNFVYQPNREADDTVSGVTWIAYEVTEQVLAKQKVERSENYFRQLTDTVPAIIWITEVDGSCTYLNKHWYDYTGQTREQAEGFGWLDATHPDDKESAGETFIEANAAQKPFVALYRLKNRYGDYRWAIDSGSPKFSDDGVYEGMIGTVVDVHEEKQAEEKLRYRKALLEAHNEASFDAILLVDATGKIISYNQRFLEIWNMPQPILDDGDDEAALSFAMTQLVNPQQFLDQVKYLYENPKETSTDELEHKDGRIIERHGYPVVGENGTYYAWSWTFKDVTAQKKAEKTVKESEERFRNMADESPMFVFIIEPDAQATINYWNRTWLSYTGQTIEEAVGRAWDGIIHPDDVPVVMEIYVPAFQNRLSYIIPAVRVKRYDGEYRWHSFKGNPRYLSDGGFGGYIGVGFDIHEQKLAEEALKESEERFRSLADQSPMIVYLVEPTPEASMSYFNRTWLSYTGRTFEEAIGRAWDGVVHPDDLQDVFDTYAPAFENRQSYTLPAVRLKRFDGEYRWHLFKGNPRYLPNGEFIGFVGVGIDIHEQKTTADTIRDSEEKFRLLADEMPQFVWTGDASGRLNYFNQAVYNYSGLTEADVLSGGWLQIVHPDDREENVRLWLEAIASGEPFLFEHRFRRDDGEYRWQLSRAVAQKDTDGTIQRWIGTSTDIHDQKEVEEKLESLVNDRTKELSELNLLLLQSNEDLQQFAHVASHDLKEPVRKIKTFAGRLEEEIGSTLTEKSKVFLDKVQSAANRMYAMIDGVLAYSALNASEQISDTIDLNEVMRNIESDLELIIQQKRARIIYSNLPAIEGAPVLIHQLFYNLVNNSLKFAKKSEPPVISISSEIIYQQKNHFVKLAVKDNGIGFEPTQAQKIFETFTRLNSKDQYEGTGLGLSLCKKIVQRHGGSIEAFSEKGKGAEFIIMLPVNAPL